MIVSVYGRITTQLAERHVQRPHFGSLYRISYIKVNQQGGIHGKPLLCLHHTTKQDHKEELLCFKWWHGSKLRCPSFRLEVSRYQPGSYDRIHTHFVVTPFLSSSTPLRSTQSQPPTALSLHVLSFAASTFLFAFIIHLLLVILEFLTADLSSQRASRRPDRGVWSFSRPTFCARFQTMLKEWDAIPYQMGHGAAAHATAVEGTDINELQARLRHVSALSTASYSRHVRYLAEFQSVPAALARGTDLRKQCLRRSDGTNASCFAPLLNVETHHNK